MNIVVDHLGKRYQESRIGSEYSNQGVKDMKGVFNKVTS